MWPSITARHCNDELLLAHADGELSRWRRWRVQRHLDVCWQCRARHHELDEEARRIAQALSKSSYPSPVRVSAAREDVLERIRIDEQHRVPAPKFQTGAQRSWRFSTAAALAAIIAVAGGVWFASMAPSVPAAEEVLARAAAFERLQARAPLEQELTIEMTAGTTPHAGRLQVWADAGTGRYASRWTSLRGRLEHAVWRPSSDRLYVYDRAAGPKIVRRDGPSRDVKLWDGLPAPGLRPDQVEQSFLRWLENRSWRPISLARGLARLASTDGFVMAVAELEEGGDSARRFVVTIRDEGSGRGLELQLVVDAVTYRPLAERVRFVEAGRQVEFRLTPERTVVLARGRSDEVLSRGWVQRVVFGGNLTIPSLRAPRRALVPEHREVAPVSPVTRDLRFLEIEVRYALHRVRACLGESLQLRRQAGQLQVTGLVASPERKAEIQAALGQVSGAGYVDIQLQSVEEAAGLVPAADPPVRGLAAGPEVLTVASPVVSPLEAPFVNYFRENGLTSRAATARFTSLSNQSIESADSILTQAWALRRLAEEFGASEEASLRTEARWLVEVMIQDHLRELGEVTAALRRSLAPPLRAVSGESAADMGLRAGDEAQAWDEAVFETFGSAQELSRLLVTTFAGSAEGAPLPERELALQLTRELARLRGRVSESAERLPVPPAGARARGGAAGKGQRP